MQIPIIFENEHFLVINKPAGIAVHADGKKQEYTIADWFLEKYPDLQDVGEPMMTEYQGKSVTIHRPGIVHRLDKETSGCMVLAKDQETYLFLKRKFKSHEVKKIYHACVYGSVPHQRGLIDAGIAREVGSHARWTTSRRARGVVREARTRYVVQSTVEYEHDRFSYLVTYPETGRTHQIRVHMKHIHHPLVCDPLYAYGKNGGLGFSRLALHAHTLIIPLPGGGEYQAIAQFPEDFLRARKIFGIL